jgi:heme-degrading monooxygenase HmoA
MMHTIMRVKVKDYDKWKIVFDGNSATRKTAEAKGGRLFHNVDDSSEVIIYLRWETMENARKFFNSEELKKRMQESGVIDKPDIFYLEEVESL